MSVSAEEARLEDVKVDKIDRNPENPRVIFRPGEFENLLDSIQRYGIQVPISVYKEGAKYVLMDGERRWLCALKLNYKTIPALVQNKPTPLENLLLMFNIHALREQWDLLTVALKLPRIIALLAVEIGRQPTIYELSDRTGLKTAMIRRCKLLMSLPDEYKEQILEELRKPKPQQKLTEDLFIEIERALTTVERALPATIPDRDVVRRVLLKKYKSEIIDNRVLFRKVAKIARSYKVGVDAKVATKELKKLFGDNNYSIDKAYENSVGDAYAGRDLGTRITSLSELLDNISSSDLDQNIRDELQALTEKIVRLLRGGE